MIQSFDDDGTADIYNGENTKKARTTCPRELWDKANKLLDALNTASVLEDAERTPGADLHPLKGDQEGRHAVSINRQYRISFRWTDQGPENVRIEDYH